MSKVIAERLAKGSFLALWIVILVLMAKASYSGRAAAYLMNHSNHEEEVTFYFENVDEKTLELNYIEPTILLEQYIRKNREILGPMQKPPPISSMLETLSREKGWNRIDEIWPAPLPSPAQINEYYKSLFSAIDKRLWTVVIDESINEKSYAFDTNIIPYYFKEALLKKSDSRDSNYENNYIALTEEVILWISSERARQKEEKERLKLANTFILLIVLGAFGSLIFLTKSFIEKERGVTISAYLFRPFLGMFLAVAIFIIDIMAHSVISKAGILDIRHETLFVLALGSGLMSEQAYLVVTERAKAAFKRDEEKEKGAGKTGIDG